MTIPAKLAMATGHYHMFHLIAPTVAHKKGWFREEGLTEDIHIFPTGDDDKTLDGLLAGEIDFAIDPKTANVLKRNARGDDVYIIGGWLNAFYYALVGAKGISSVQDLRGKRIGVRVPETGIDVKHVSDFLRHHGLDPKGDVTFVQAGHTTARVNRPLLDRGEIHARAVFRPEGYKMAAEGYPLLVDFTEFYKGGVQVRVVATTGRMIQEHPEVVKAVMKGLIRAYRLMRRDHAQVMELVKDAELPWEDDLDPEAWDQPYPPMQAMPEDGSVTMEGLRRVVEEEKAVGALPQDYQVEKALRLELVQAACQEVDRAFGPGGYE